MCEKFSTPFIFISSSGTISSPCLTLARRIHFVSDNAKAITPIKIRIEPEIFNVILRGSLNPVPRSSGTHKPAIRTTGKVNTKENIC